MKAQRLLAMMLEYCEAHEEDILLKDYEMSVAKRLEKAYKIRDVDVTAFATLLTVTFKTNKEHIIEIDTRECHSMGIEAYHIWLYKRLDLELQPFLI